MLAYLDCRHGFSIPALLGAFAHLGLDFTLLNTRLHAAGLHSLGEVHESHGIAGHGATVLAKQDTVQSCGEQEARDMLSRAALSPAAMALVSSALMALDEVDPRAEKNMGENLSLLTAFALGLEMLGIEALCISPLPWPHNPPPSSALVQLMRGMPISKAPAENTTISPLGMALIHSLTHACCPASGLFSGSDMARASAPFLSARFAEGPEGVLHAVGTGYGMGEEATLVRVLLLHGPGAEEDGSQREEVLMLESHVDHLTGEELGAALTALMALPEVLDVLWLPGTGKKNRPAGALRVLCLPQHGATVRKAYFTHTHTLGLRCHSLTRWILPRGQGTAQVRGGELKAKTYVLDGQTFVRPECDELTRVAAHHALGLPGMRFENR